jgi:DNA helicase II / ATP-dependent DNA helicase PcrA
MKQELSKEQKDIVFFKDSEGPLLVEASAGSGKTRILTERVRHLLTEKADKFFSVLCLTFTNKAAEEMKERLQDVPKLSERAFIGTFHEFCLSQIIRKQRQEIGFESVPHIFDDNDRKKILEEVFLQNQIFEKDYKDLNSKEQQKRIQNYLDIISDAKRELVVSLEIDRTHWTEKRQILYNDYNDRLRNQNAMDYDDILLYAYRILSERPAIANLYRRLYKFILVDEAQDLNFAQYNIVKAICGDTHKNVTMVGDPKQAIYSFNGASVHFMQDEFVNDFGATKLEILNNYRSSAEVLKLAHSIRPNGGIPNNYFTGVCEIRSFENEQKEAEWIISKIKEWISVGTYEEKEVKTSLKLDNIAVLARNRYIFKELIVQLDNDAELKTNFYLRKGVERFMPESHLIKVFDLGLRILVNPADILHFYQLYQELGIPISKSKNRLETLLILNKEENLSDENRSFLDMMTGFWGEINTNPILVDKVLKNISENLDQLGLIDEEKLKIDYDINEFQKLWKAFLKNTPSRSHNLANFRYFLALNTIDEKKHGLTLATVHTVKGLEYDIVFLMGMNEGVLPDYRAKDEKAISEERNNAYVAVTRAKKCIYVTYPKSREMPWGGAKIQHISTFITNTVAN